ncbi:hypothetical protein ACFL3L_01740 [Candidatus Neomarinimicrobiota bacterium]
MEPVKMYYDVRDIFRAPRLGLSGKKIWVFLIANIVGYLAYFVLTYIALACAGINFITAWYQFGLYPCLFGININASWWAWVIYIAGVIVWFYAITLSCTAVARITYKQLMGDEFYSAGDGYRYIKNHLWAIIFTPITLFFIVVFFIGLAAIFALFGKLPFLGEFLFAFPYLLYFFGSIFTIYTAVVLLISFIYTPAIVATIEEDTMGTVFQNYSVAWSQPWRIIAYHSLLIPITILGFNILKWFWIAGYKLINVVYGHEWLMGSKLINIVGWATNSINPLTKFQHSIHVLPFCSATYNCGFSENLLVAASPINSTEYIAGVIVAIFLFILMFSLFSYALSILSVGETIMFVIFKKKSDNVNLLDHKDEDEREEENGDHDEGGNLDTDSKDQV